MASINQVAISGNLTRDCEVRESRGGMAVVSFTVAVNERKRSRDGEWEDVPSFIDCKVFGEYGRVISSRLVRGARVTVSGRLSQSRWEKDGEKRSKVEVVAQTVETMSAGQAVARSEARDAYCDEDIPF